MVNANIHYCSGQIEEFYKKNRIRWDQFYESEKKLFERIGVNEHSSLLDLGCGCGGLGLAFREKYGVTDYTGIDINKAAINTARVMNPEGNFFAGDMLSESGLIEKNKQGRRGGGYDIVVSLSCIDWNVELDLMLQKAWSMVNLGGCFVASFRLTTGRSCKDINNSFQYTSFSQELSGEIAPYIVLNVSELAQKIAELSPKKIIGNGYWGEASRTAVTKCTKPCFVVLAIYKSMLATRHADRCDIDIDAPHEIVDLFQKNFA